MHQIEPFYSWRTLYIASEDAQSPFYGRGYSEFEFSNAVYNYFIHPQWDAFGSATLYVKILFADYDQGYCIIEFVGEWNDLLYSDIMHLKRDVLEPIMDAGINKFLLIGENILNSHIEEDDYYQEWFDDIEDGWIVALNFRDHVRQEFERAHIDYYIAFGGGFNDFFWQELTPMQLYEKVDKIITKRLNP